MILIFFLLIHSNSNQSEDDYPKKYENTDVWIVFDSFFTPRVCIFSAWRLVEFLIDDLLPLTFF